jgi:hypothetical protein
VRRERGRERGEREGEREGGRERSGRKEDRLLFLDIFFSLAGLTN